MRGGLATGAQAEEFEAMGELGEAVSPGEFLFECGGETVVNFDNHRALTADEVVVV